MSIHIWIIWNVKHQRILVHRKWNETWNTRINHISSLTNNFELNLDQVTLVLPVGLCYMCIILVKDCYPVVPILQNVPLMILTIETYHTSLFLVKFPFFSTRIFIHSRQSDYKLVSATLNNRGFAIVNPCIYIEIIYCFVKSRLDRQINSNSWSLTNTWRATVEIISNNTICACGTICTQATELTTSCNANTYLN